RHRLGGAGSCLRSLGASRHIRIAHVGRNRSAAHRLRRRHEQDREKYAGQQPGQPDHDQGHSIFFTRLIVQHFLSPPFYLPFSSSIWNVSGVTPWAIRWHAQRTSPLHRSIMRLRIGWSWLGSVVATQYMKRGTTSFTTPRESL